MVTRFVASLIAHEVPCSAVILHPAQLYVLRRFGRRISSASLGTSSRAIVVCVADVVQRLHAAFCPRQCPRKPAHLPKAVVVVALAGQNSQSSQRDDENTR